jgi:CRISPR type III-B/RAMP module RAMP protein Cmr6
MLPPGAVSFTATLGGRLIINQAGGIMENAGLCLHRHFGDPYIPGSAVKGIARHAAWCEWQAEQNEEKKREIAQGIARVFGYPTGAEGLDGYLEPNKQKRVTSSGTVAFLAAIPDGKVSLETDIVNCHHPKYYAHNEQYPDATDNEAPNPQFFPTVAAGSEFRFTLVPSNRLPLTDKDVLPQARKWLVTALTLHGAGAKTAAGYGWFDYDEAAEDRKRMLAEERATREQAAANIKTQEEEKRISNAAKKARLEAMTPEQRADDEVTEWKDDALVVRMQKFHDVRKGPSDLQKAAIIRALRGDRLAVWTTFKAKATKGDLANAAGAICKWCKDMGLGKMP